jgi:hypothetical protein
LRIHTHSQEIFPIHRQRGTDEKKNIFCFHAVSVASFARTTNMPTGLLLKFQSTGKVIAKEKL